MINPVISRRHWRKIMQSRLKITWSSPAMGLILSFSDIFWHLCYDLTILCPFLLPPYICHKSFWVCVCVWVENKNENPCLEHIVVILGEQNIDIIIACILVRVIVKFFSHFIEKAWPLFFDLVNSSFLNLHGFFFINILSPSLVFLSFLNFPIAHYLPWCGRYQSSSCVLSLYHILLNELI